jgi:Tol biopolymer transport system component/tRNA A-37 threonylcarbamoyl transferase component Bud32
MIGKMLAHYEISAPLGRGGMGEVFKARDHKLGREVAIKLLPEAFARDTDRVARFQREAKLLASLNHPNIAAIYGLEATGGTNFLVLELVEGETLAELIAGNAGVLAGKDTAETAALPGILNIALQIAEALEAAHEKGVIHRDLKPANIKVTPEGKVKVLDFGLAKAFAGEQAELNLSNSPTRTYSPTLSNAATQQGVILGTAAYMSPDQARGKTVDKRADIWAFGCVLYEMLTGQAAFQGEDITEILASVVKGGANLDLLPANIHPRVRELLTRCLQKDLKRRYQDIGDVRCELEQILADPSGVLAQPVTAMQTRMRLRTMLPWIAAAVILTAIIAGAVVWKLKATPPPEPRQVTRFEHNLTEDQQLIHLAYPLLAVSPNGRQFIYVTTKGFCLRSMDELDTRLISSVGESPRNPFFSPDGQWVGYLSNNKLKKVAIGGGAPVVLCDVGNISEAIWNSDNTIIYSRFGKGIMRVSAGGGTPEVLIGEEKGNFYHPRLLPGGRSVLFTLGTNEGYEIVVQALESRERKVLFKGDDAWYLPTGHIVYALENNLFAVPFNLNTLQKAGRQVPMVQGVLRFSPVWQAQYVVSISGTLVYIPETVSTASPKRTLVWVDRNGKEEPLAGAPSDNYGAFRISPDGTRVALTANTSSKSDIWIWNLVRETITRLTFNEGSEYPLWTPDGKRIAFSSSRGGMVLGDVYWKADDGTGEEEKIGALQGRSLYPWSWSDDGKTLVLMDQAVSGEKGATLGSHIGALSIAGDRKWKPLLQEKYYEGHPQISPNGRWMAYVSGEPYQSQVYVCPFPEMDKGKWQISAGGGTDPLWSHDGRELFYRAGDSIIAVDVQTAEPTFKPGKPKPLFRGAYSNGGHRWDLSPDGKRFLMLKEPQSTPSAGGGPRKINIVLNWLEELKQRVPTK